MVMDLLRSLFDNQVEEISPEEVKAGDYVVLDVRKQAAYQNGHIPGSLNLPYSKEEQWEQVLAGVNQKAEIAVICVRGISSKTVAGKLLEAGYENVKSVKGGMKNWTGEIEQG